VLEKAACFMAWAKRSACLELMDVATVLAGYLPAMRQVAAVARRRAFDGEKVPNADKVFSIFEPHAELIIRGRRSHPIEFGVSSHVGDMILFIPPAPGTGVSRRTWSLNFDVRVPITSRFGVQGELWTGENLATYFGGIGQGINLAAPYNTIRSRGGWVDVWYDWSDRVHSHIGYSIDDPVDSDITSGRTYNAFLFTNVSYDVTKKFLVGFEFTSWRTLWKAPYADAPDQHFDFVAKYGF